MFDVVVVILLVFIGFGWSFDRRLPKIELHSHLHGSVRLGTLVELATVHDSQVVDAAQLKDTTDPFDIFKAIHALVDERAAFERIFDEMVDDLFADGTVYAEIRTTPRALKDLTREDYVAVLVEKAVRHNNSPRGQRLQLRLILSINRANSLDEAMSLVKMVQTARQNPTGRIIVGIDFSGNPLKSDFGSFLAAFRLASRLGLSVTIHSGEDERLADEEMGLILDYLASSSGPSRLGHAVHIDERHVQGLLTRFAEGGRTAVPLIEIPPTSNMFTLKLDGTLSRHPTLGRWLEAGFPVAIAVDDSGVFNTTLTQEMTLVRDTFKLDDASMVVLAAAPISHIFDEDVSEKERLRGLFYVYAEDAALEGCVTCALDSFFGTQKSKEQEQEISPSQDERRGVWSVSLTLIAWGLCFCVTSRKAWYAHKVW